MEIYISGNYTNNCKNDGVPREQACVKTSIGLVNGPNNRPLILDGAITNASSYYRLRYVDDNDSLKTIMGTMPFYGDGLDKSLIKSNIAGIYYKTKDEKNQEAFPEGLYFNDSTAMIFGRIDKDGKVEVIAGNQSQIEDKNKVTGDRFDHSMSLGVPYWGGNMHAITFNSEGLPILRVGSSDNSLMIVDSRRYVRYLNPTIKSSMFENHELTDSPSQFGMHVYGGFNNLPVKDELKIFRFGSYYNPSSNSTTIAAQMSLFDFEKDIITHIMGDRTKTAAVSPDDLSGGNLKDKQFGIGCRSGSACFMEYDKEDDRLYFSESSSLRFITNPENPEISTLQTLVKSNRVIFNFIFSKDRTKLFYLNSSSLYCIDLVGESTWCNNTSLGPNVSIGTINNGASQLTWLDDKNLLVSTYNGLILKLELPE